MNGNVRDRRLLSVHPRQLLGNVHVWYVALDLPRAEVRRLAGLLSADERRRAARFVFDQDRRRYVVSHGLLRCVLAGYLGMPPSRLEFCVESGGKPALKSSSGGARLRFNLSHSGDMALFAVARERAVGIDVEHCRPFPGATDLARRFFSPSEYAAMRSLSAGMQTSYFYSLWTCKEACLKATGEGLARLDDLEIAIPQNGSAVCLVEGVGGKVWSGWTLRRLDPPAGYVAALAVQGEGWNLIEIPDAMSALGGQPANVIDP